MSFFEIVRWETDSQLNSDVISETSPPLTFQIFDRLDSIEEEAFLGMVEIRPRLVNGLLVDQWFPLESRSDEQVSGEIRVQIRYEKFDVSQAFCFFFFVC